MRVPFALSFSYVPMLLQTSYQLAAAVTFRSTAHVSRGEELRGQGFIGGPYLTTSGPQYTPNVARWRPECKKKMPWMD